MLRIVVFGAGAVGGNFAVRLAQAGNDVSVVARGDHLSAIRARGLTLRSGREEHVALVKASDRPDELGPQDLVISTLKSSSLGALATGVAPLLGPDTPVIFAQNGIPWWYEQGLSASRRRPPDLSRLDPGGALAAAIPPDRVLGGVISSANDIVEPGVVVNDSPSLNQLIVGEPDDGQTDRIELIRAALNAAGIASPATSDIRRAIWTKLLRNLTGSLIALITRQTSGSVSRDPNLTELTDRLLNEGLDVAAGHGFDLRTAFVDRDALRHSARDHKPSILQDYERGRQMEIESLIRAPVAYGRAIGLSIPCLETVAALAVRLASDRGLYAG